MIFRWHMLTRFLHLPFHTAYAAVSFLVQDNHKSDFKLPNYWSKKFPHTYLIFYSTDISEIRTMPNAMFASVGMPDVWSHNC